MEENCNDVNIFHDKMLMLGFCPGYKPSREFLEFATKEVDSIIHRTHKTYNDALDDAVISILLLKKREFKKDHRVWLHKSSTKGTSKRPCLSHDALKLKADIQDYIRTNLYASSDPIKTCDSKRENLADIESCPVHKKDCKTWLHKVQAKYNDVKEIVCEWYRQNEWRYTQNKEQYLRKLRPNSKVQFQLTSSEIEPPNIKEDPQNKYTTDYCPYYEDTEASNGVTIREVEGSDENVDPDDAPSDTPLIGLRSSKRDIKLNTDTGFNYTTTCQEVSPFRSPRHSEGSDTSLISDGWEKVNPAYEHNHNLLARDSLLSLSQIAPRIQVTEISDDSDDGDDHSAPVPDGITFYGVQHDDVVDKDLNANNRHTYSD